MSYRWGELNGQQVEKPDYTAHITSFDLHDLGMLCYFIQKKPDLKEIPYLWIDAISVDQQNKDKKKDIILKMNQIYQHATYILAIPDLHKKYLLKSPANNEILFLIEDEYKEIIYKEVLYNKRSYITKFINDNDNKSSITTNYMQQQQQCTNNNYYIIIQKLKDLNMTNEYAIKIIEELEIVNKELKTEMNELIIENKNKEKEIEESIINLKLEGKKKNISF